MREYDRERHDRLEVDILAAKDREESIADQRYDGEELVGVDLTGLEFERVEFYHCRLSGCIFDKCSFFSVKLEDCDLSNSKFRSCYVKNTRFLACKGDGGDFSDSSMIGSSFEKGSYHYANYGSTLWENCILTDCDLQDGFMSQVKFKKTKFQNVNLSHVDFFKTVLKGIDLSECMIEGIVVSDTYSEIKGLKINAAQAADIALLFGVKIV